MKKLRTMGSRIIKVKKTELVEKIQANKLKHVENYLQALIDYKDEALKQLKELTKRAKDGDVRIGLQLVTPVNNEAEYDKLLLMLKMEIDEEIELSMSEFNEYVHDETHYAQQASLSNSMYFKG